MSLSKKTLRLLKFMYWIVAIFIHLYVCYKLFTSERPITGVVWLVLGFVLLFVMYFYYFNSLDNESSWPPYITVCPDYLTSIPETPGSKVIVCVDFVGLNNPNIQKSDPAFPPVPTDSDYNKKVFRINGMTTSEKIKSAKDKDLTWQGLF